MDFGEVKREIWMPLSSSAARYMTTEKNAVGELNSLIDILKRMDDSRNQNQFLEEAFVFYDVIMNISRDKISRDKRFNEEQAEIMRAIVTGFSRAVICILSNIHDSDAYEKNLYGLEQFKNLISHPVFAIGIFLLYEELSLGKKTSGSYADDVDKLFEKIIGPRTSINNISTLANNIISRKGPFRKELYTKISVNCPWVIKCGLITRDRYLDILLKHFIETGEDINFILAVNTLISPVPVEDETVEAGVDMVISNSFGVIPDKLKKDTIEQCSYRDIFSERKESKKTDPCPEKVLEPVLRRHICKMIQTMWQDDLETQEDMQDMRKLLKFNCIDCAYVSAMIKKEFFSSLGGETDDTYSRRRMVKDNHDDSRTMSDIFNIILKDTHVLVIKLVDSKLEIRFYDGTSKKHTGNDNKLLEVAFSLDDYQLENLECVLKKEKIIATVIEYSKNPNGSDFHYSLVYLENYRGIDCVSVSFDHLFTITRSEETVALDKEDSEGLINHFYGKNILSLTGFVGKNGAGKTSIIDFLRDSFPRICKDLYIEKLHAKDGVIDIDALKMPEYRLEDTICEKDIVVRESTHFFIVFYFGGEYYYLTNFKFRDEASVISDIECKQVKDSKSLIFRNVAGISPYQIGLMLPMYGNNRKIVYFSQLLSSYGVANLENEKYRKEDMKRSPADELEINKYVFQRDRVFPDQEEGIIDLSEENFNNYRYQKLGDVLNVSLIMQLLFYYSEKKRLGVYFKEDFHADKLEVVSPVYCEPTCIIELKAPLLGFVIQDPQAYIRPFSSGQYSKYVLLSRLFWCIKGWEIFPEVFEKKSQVKEIDLVKPEFARPLSWTEIRDEIIRYYLRQTDSAVLFFDESDPYYHPNWQRGFVQDILDMIERHRKNPVQVVFTTNSPLMLSDLVQKDIYLMKEYKTTLSNSDTKSRLNVTGRRNPSIPTFGQNIHTLMAKPFFLERTIGKFADQRIAWLVGLLTDTSKIVEYLRDKKHEDNDVKKIIDFLKNEHAMIYAKSMAIWEAVKDSDKTAQEEFGSIGVVEDIRAKRNRFYKVAGSAERDYVTAEIRKKFFAEVDFECKKELSFDCVVTILLNHIKLIGESVLENELFDMYSDFVTRVDYSTDLDTLILRKEEELKRLKIKKAEKK